MKFECTEVFEKLYETYSLNKYRQIVLYGGSRSGKTYALMQLMIMIMMETPGIVITVWRNKKVTCRATIMKDFKNAIKSDYILQQAFIENKTDGKFIYKYNGASISFEGSDDEDKVLGHTQDISIFNEITGFSELVYLQITQRTNMYIFADYNPSKKFWLNRHENRQDTVFLHSYYRMNKFCPENIRLQLEGYEPWETGSYEIRREGVYYNGKPISDKNQPPPHKKNVYEKSASVYHWLVYGLGLLAEKEHKVYKGWSTISREEYLALDYKEYYGLDFGTKNPTAMVGVKYDGDNTFYLDQKIYKPLSKTSLKLHELIEKGVNDKNNDLIVCDPSKKSYINNLRDNGFFIKGGNKNPGSVELGISLIVGFKIVYTIESDDIDEEYYDYEFELDKYDEPTDKPKKENDHIMDAIRYIIEFLVRYLNITV